LTGGRRHKEPLQLRNIGALTQTSRIKLACTRRGYQESIGRSRRGALPLTLLQAGIPAEQRVAGIVEGREMLRPKQVPSAIYFKSDIQAPDRRCRI